MLPQEHDPSKKGPQMPQLAIATFGKPSATVGLASPIGDSLQHPQAAYAAAAGLSTAKGAAPPPQAYDTPYPPPG